MKVARPAIVIYVDLCQHDNVTTQEFFEKLGLCKLQMQGFVVEDECDGVKVLKILQVDDTDGCSNSQGMVIPLGCVQKLIYLEGEEPLDEAEKVLA